VRQALAVCARACRNVAGSHRRRVAAQRRDTSGSADGVISLIRTDDSSTLDDARQVEAFVAAHALLARVVLEHANAHGWLDAGAEDEGALGRAFIAQHTAFVTAQAQQEASAHGWIVVLERGAPVSCDGNRCVQLIQSGAGADTLYFEESVTLAAVGSVVGCSTFRCDGRVGRASQTLADHNYVDGTAVNLRLQLRLMLRGGMDGGVSDTGGTEAYRSLTGPATAGAAVAVEQGEDVSHWKKLGALIEALRAARHTSEPTRASARNEPGAPAPSASPSANVLRFGLKSMGGPGISVATRAPGDGSAHGKLLGLLHEFAAAFLPSTKYSTIQINFDTKYGIHTDEVCSVAVDVQKSDYRS
jgi:hypothetical protein